MSEVGTNERLLRSDVTLEESRKIERVLEETIYHILRSGISTQACSSSLITARILSAIFMFIWILWTRQRNCLQICRIYL